MELCHNPYHSHVSPTKHRIIMHTKSHANIQPTIQSCSLRKIIPNSSIPVPLCHIGYTAPRTALWVENTTPKPKWDYYDESKAREEKIWVEDQLTWNRDGVQLA